MTQQIWRIGKALNVPLTIDKQGKIRLSHKNWQTIFSKETLIVVFHHHGK